MASDQQPPRQLTDHHCTEVTAFLRTTPDPGDALEVQVINCPDRVGGIHSNIPPCHCLRCVALTIAADARRQEIVADLLAVDPHAIVGTAYAGGEA